MNHPKLRLTVPWDSIDPLAQQQIEAVLALPQLERLAIMPDVHGGYDLCIGGVALLREAVSPSFVGYDIGCGMCHVNTKMTLKELGLDKKEDRERLYADLVAAIPAGKGRTGNRETDLTFSSATGDKELDARVGALVQPQFATLGGGNHFLEIGTNADGIVGVTIHSGSRRPGHDIASWYEKKGRIFPLESALGAAYLEDMNWALEFALANRKAMLETALDLMGFFDFDIAALLEDMINENHNHADLQDDRMVLHRKGATPAQLGQWGVIPANQKDGVWITRGLGNEDFLSSASHGAGRTMSRKQAAAHGSVPEFKRLMEGVVCRTDEKILDEGPWAYKDINAVLAAQDGILVDVVDRFVPVIVLKG